MTCWSCSGARLGFPFRGFGNGKATLTPLRERAPPETTATTPGPAPGYLAGGPNTGFAPDGCCTATQGDPAYQCYGSGDFALCSQNWNPPMGQPQQKSYLEYNGGWPVGSWPITEPSTGYQAKYVLVLAAYAR